MNDLFQRAQLNRVPLWIPSCCFLFNMSILQAKYEVQRFVKFWIYNICEIKKRRHDRVDLLPIQINWEDRFIIRQNDHSFSEWICNVLLWISHVHRCKSQRDQHRQFIDPKITQIQQTAVDYHSCSSASIITTSSVEKI